MRCGWGVERIGVRSCEFVDELGRVRLFRGVNVVCKERARGYTYEMSKAELERLEECGFNVVRLGVIWDGLEPEPGVIDEEYLGRLEEQARALAEHGMYVLLDMHQDLYSVRFSDGAPEWATLTDGLPEPGEVVVWSDAYMSEAVQRAFDHFWANDPAPDGLGLQDHFAACWRALAGRLGSRPWLLGYDIFNEPFPGSLASRIYSAIFEALSRVAGIRLEDLYARLASAEGRASLLQLLDDERAYEQVLRAAEPLVREFEIKYLLPFYERVVEAIRSVEPRGVVFLEDCYFCNAGVPTGILTVSRGGSREPCQAYAPHVYDLVVDTPYVATHFSAKRVKAIVDAKRRAQERLGVPVLVGEWGAFGHHRGVAPHCEFMLELFDDAAWSWAYWAWTPDFWSSEAAGLLARPYPAAVSGRLLLFKFRRRRFEMEWVPEPSLRAPTLIRLPKSFDPIEVRVEPRASVRVVEEGRALFVEVRAERAGKHAIAVEGCA
jgi:endoglycosylceramidase